MSHASATKPRRHTPRTTPTTPLVKPCPLQQMRARVPHSAAPTARTLTHGPDVRVSSSWPTLALHDILTAASSDSSTCANQCLLERRATLYRSQARSISPGHGQFRERLLHPGARGRGTYYPPSLCRFCRHGRLPQSAWAASRISSSRENWRGDT